MFYKKNINNVPVHSEFLEESKLKLKEILIDQLLNGPIKYNIMLEST